MIYKRKDTCLLPGEPKLYNLQCIISGKKHTHVHLKLQCTCKNCDDCPQDLNLGLPNAVCVTLT